MQRPTRRICLVASEYFISYFVRSENVSALPFHANWYQLSFKYTVRTIPFFNCVAKAHPRNLTLIFLPFCPDSEVSDTFLVPSMVPNPFCKPLLLAKCSFSNTTTDGFKLYTSSSSRALNGQDGKLHVLYTLPQ